MFFVLHILMFLFIYPTLQSSLAINKKNINQDAFYGKRTTLQTDDHSLENTTNFMTHKLLFQIIQNLTNTKATNLKSNVFDKMLSDEMLSIKKHFYEKDNIRSTISVKTSTKNNAATPTLEVKQKWSLLGFTEKPVNVIRDENSLKNNKKIRKLLPAFEIGEKSDNIEEEIQNAKVNEKVLGLRSLPEATPLSHFPPCQHPYRVCTCMKTNPSTTCSHLCTGARVTASCSHTSNCVDCTRNTQQYSISHVYYQPYFVGVTTQLPYVNAYYHPDVMNELKVPRKPKHRKTTKPYIDQELYYDSDDPNNDKYYDDYLDYYKDIRKPVNDETEDEIKIHMIEFDEKEKNKRKHKKRKCNHHGKRKNRDKLVQDIFDDLKSYYSDSVIKDCYCVSSSSLVDNHLLLFVVYVLCLVVY